MLSIPSPKPTRAPSAPSATCWRASGPHDAHSGRGIWRDRPARPAGAGCSIRVDGTRAFITGRHEWGSLIALEKDGVPVLGILDQPVLGERFIGVNGAAALHQAEQMHAAAACAPAPTSKDAILCATDPSAYFSAEQQAAFQRVSKAARMTRYGGDCYLFAALALGFVDLIIEAQFPALGYRGADSAGGRRRRHHHRLGWRRLPRRQNHSRPAATSAYIRRRCALAAPS